MRILAQLNSRTFHLHFSGFIWTHLEHGMQCFCPPLKRIGNYSKVSHEINSGTQIQALGRTPQITEPLLTRV